jgi:hypothetical protein
MSLADTALNIAFREGLKQTSGSLSYAGNSATVVVGYLTSKQFDQEDAGFQSVYGDLTIIVRSSDISTWNLQRDSIVGIVAKHTSGSFSIRDPVRYVGDFVWYNLDTIA